jgi:predicted nucleic acid-binding protein
VRLLVDTGVFSAAISRRRRVAIDAKVRLLSGQQLFLAAQSVAELRFGALVAEWGPPRRAMLEGAIAAATVVPVTDALVNAVAELRAACRRAGHPLADRVHGNDLWIAASAVHIGAILVTMDRVFNDVPGISLL